MASSIVSRQLRVPACPLATINRTAPMLPRRGSWQCVQQPIRITPTFGRQRLPFHATSRALAQKQLPLFDNNIKPLGEQQQTPPSSHQPGLYTPPKALSFLPKAWIPYAELMRLDKPIGTYYLFFPCLFSTLMAAPLATPMATPASVLGTTALFFTGALVMRGAGCTINDLWDRNLDPHVERTRLRPIARRAVTPFRALAFTGAQLLTGLAVLLQFPVSCLFYGVPSLVLVTLYPLAKRVTYYPQVVLGLTFSWGAIMGFPALGVDLLANPWALASAALLYSSNIAWTVLYDMIYAHMDAKDDVKAGIKSIALKHFHETKEVLAGLAAVQTVLLTCAGMAAGAGPAFFILSGGAGYLALRIMIKRVNLKNPKDCWHWFVRGCGWTGGAITSGLFVDYCLRYREDQEFMEEQSAATERLLVAA